MASARAAKVSIIRLTQSICVEVSGGSWKMQAPANTMNMATTLTVAVAEFLVCRNKLRLRRRCLLVRR